MMELVAIIAIGAAVAGVALLLFLVILAIPFGAPTVADYPTAAPTREVRSPSVAPSVRLAAAAPKGYIAWLERQIVYAGREKSWSAGGFILAKLLGTAFAVTLAWLVLSVGPPPLFAFLAVAFVILAFFAPEVIAWSRADDRQKLITLALPDTLDQMTIAVEAGLGFDAALQKAATNGRGPLAEELIRTLQDQSIGRSRRDAYRALELRTNSPDLRRFIRAISQADAFGISVADVLRVQARDMRVRRRQRAEEQAMKVPVKVVFPLVFCILPVLFIVILTPAVIGLVGTFSQ
jgi:tight adherence protein C